MANLLEIEGVKHPVSYFSEGLQRAFLALPEELRDLKESELIEKIDPTFVDYGCRRNFWKAVREAERNGEEKIETKSVFQGVCSAVWFYTRYLKDPYRVAWLFLPLGEFEQSAQIGADVGLTKLLSYVSKNDVNRQNLGQYLKVVMFLADRGYGALMQKVHMQSKNVNLDVSVPISNQGPMNPEELLQKLEKVKTELLSVPKGQVIDVKDESTEAIAEGTSGEGKEA